MSSRHKYGTFALILAVLAFLLSIFSTGATWATVDDRSTAIEDESFFDNLTIEVALQGDLQLTEMDSEVEVAIFFEGSDEPIEEQTFRESESYEELAEKSYRRYEGYIRGYGYRWICSPMDDLAWHNCDVFNSNFCILFTGSNYQ